MRIALHQRNTLWDPIESSPFPAEERRAQSQLGFDKEAPSNDPNGLPKEHA